MTLIIIMYALFGASIPIVKVLVQHVHPIFLTAIRSFSAGTILLAYQYFAPHEKFRFKRKHIWLYTQIILFSIYFTYILRFWGVQYLPASKAAFFFNLSPFITSIYEYFIFGEKMSRYKWCGLSIGFLGLIPMLLSSTSAESQIGEYFFISWPELAVIASVATASYGWIVMRKLVREKSYSPMMINGIAMTTSGILAFATSLIFEPLPSIEAPGTFISWLALVVFLSNILCHNLYGYLLRHYSATFVSFCGFLGPLFTALYGWSFFNEKITWHFYTSATIVFAGLYIFYRDELKPQVIKALD